MLLGMSEHNFMMKLFLLVILASMSEAGKLMLRETVNTQPDPPTESDTFALGKTDWGQWGSKEYCPTGKYVFGFRLKVEGTQGVFGDDTALNAVAFKCNDEKILTSAIGKWGGWTGWYYCPAGHFANGIKFRSESDQGNVVDDTAGNNLQVRCTDGTWLYGEGLGWGNWDEFYCGNGQRICGLETKVESPVGISDDTSLNKINVFCC